MYKEIIPFLLLVGTSLIAINPKVAFVVGLIYIWFRYIINRIGAICKRREQISDGVKPEYLIRGKKRIVNIIILIFMIIMPIIIIYYVSMPPANNYNSSSGNTILLYDFSGPQSEHYRVTENIYQYIRHIEQEYEYKVIRMYVPANTGTASNEILADMDSLGAIIAIYGWYGVTSGSVELMPEVYMKDFSIPIEFDPYYPTAFPLELLESFELQSGIGEMLYGVCIFCFGLIELSHEEWLNSEQFFSEVIDYSDETRFYCDPAVFCRSISRYEQGNYTGALEDLFVYLQDCDDSSSTLMLIGFTYIELDSLESALSFLEASVPTHSAEKYPVNLLLGLDYCYRQLGMYQEALSTAENYVEQYPDSPNAYFVRGQAHYYNDEYSHAISDFSKVAMFFTNVWNMHAQMGISYMRMNMYDEAIYRYDRVMELNHEKNYYIYANRAYCEFEKGAYISGVLDLTTSLCADTIPNIALLLKADICLNLVCDTLSALDELRDIVDANCLNEELCTKMADIYHNIGQTDSAYFYYRRTLQANPYCSEANGYVAYHYLCTNPDTAIYYYNMAIDSCISLYSTQLYLHRGIAHLTSNAFHSGLEDFLSYLEQNPDDPKALFYLGLCYAGIGMREESVKCMLRGISITPDSTEQEKFRSVLDAYGYTYGE